MGRARAETNWLPCGCRIYIFAAILLHKNAMSPEKSLPRGDVMQSTLRTHKLFHTSPPALYTLRLFFVSFIAGTGGNVLQAIENLTPIKSSTQQEDLDALKVSLQQPLGKIKLFKEPSR